MQKARGRRLGTSTQEDTQRSHQMIGRLLSKEETNAALVVALSGTIMALAAKGQGALSMGRLVSGVLSNPVPRPGQLTRGDAPIPAQRSRIAA